MALKDILIKVKGDNKDFKKKLNDSDKSMSWFAGKMKKHSGLIKAGLIGIGVAALAMSAKMISGSIKAGVAIDKMAKSTGIAYEQVSRLKYAADQEHASIEAVGLGMKRMSKTMLDASEGLAEAERTFDNLGLSIYNVDGSLRSVDDMMLESADIFASMTDDTKKAALAQELFGRSGMEMIPMLELGRDGINALGDEAERLGLVLSEDAAKDMKLFDDGMTKMKGAVAGVGLQLTTALLPSLLKFSDWISSLIDAGYLDQFVSGLKLLGNTFMLVITPIQMVINSMKTLYALIENPADYKNIIAASEAANKKLLSDKVETLRAINEARIGLLGGAVGAAKTTKPTTAVGVTSGIGGGGGDTADTHVAGGMMAAARKGITAAEYSGEGIGSWAELKGKDTGKDSLVTTQKELTTVTGEMVNTTNANVKIIQENTDATIKNTSALNSARPSTVRRGS